MIYQARPFWFLNLFRIYVKCLEKMDLMISGKICVWLWLNILMNTLERCQAFSPRSLIPIRRGSLQSNLPWQIFKKWFIPLALKRWGKLYNTSIRKCLEKSRCYYVWKSHYNIGPVSSELNVCLVQSHSWLHHSSPNNKLFRSSGCAASVNKFQKYG